ncbi:MAG: hypothetical protein ACREL6_12755, partial [Gemmatimonadales bacterium]
IGYRSTQHDTLRFRESTTAQTSIEFDEVVTLHTMDAEAGIFITFLPGDTARAWYNDLVMEVVSPTDRQRLETAPLIKRPYLLRIDQRGRVSTLEPPVVPDGIAEVADLSHAFDDFFPRLPDGALTPGLTWTDTLIHRDTTGINDLVSTSIGRFRVVRDTVVNGHRAYVVSAEQDIRLEELRAASGTTITGSHLSGSDRGWFVFDPERGRLLVRHRTGEIQGVILLTEGPDPVTSEQIYRYRQHIEAVD